MSDIAVRVDGLSKQYRIGGKQEGYRTIREAMTNAVVSPFRRAQKLIRGQAYGAAELNETIWALRGVSLEIKRGEVVGIIGRNGAGKTTLLKILSRITEPTEGQAEIYGRVGSLLEVGTGFHPELTGRENIYLNGAILGMRKSEIDYKFDEIVTFAEIEKFLDTPVKHYSSGMYVRLAFSVAAHLEPEILLVDEVLAVGDWGFQKKCLGKMQDVVHEGRTVLFVSHNMSAIRSLCKRTILLEQGTRTFDGETLTAIAAYRSSMESDRTSRDSLQFKPVDSKAQIMGIRLLTKPQENESFDYTEPISFEVTSEMRSEISSIYLGITIYNEYEDRLIFWRDFELMPELLESRIPGLYVYEVTIPEHTLPPGYYRIDVALVELTGLTLLHWPQEFLTFEVSDYDSVRTLRGLPWKSLSATPLGLNVQIIPKGRRQSIS